jgi:uncharacterized lipoprotein YmbA
MKTRFAALLFTLLLANCVSAPDYRYYTLDMNPRAEIAVPLVLTDVRIRVNEALARPEIMARVSPTKIEYYAIDRWASGLEEQVAEKLKTEFSSMQPDAYRIQIDGRLMAFEQVDTSAGADVRVKLDASVAVSGRDFPQSAGPLERIYNQTASAAAGSPDAVVEALSRAVEAVAVQIASDVQQYVDLLAREAAAN